MMTPHALTCNWEGLSSSVASCFLFQTSTGIGQHFWFPFLTEVSSQFASFLAVGLGVTWLRHSGHNTGVSPARQLFLNQALKSEKRISWFGHILPTLRWPADPCKTWLARSKLPSHALGRLTSPPILVSSSLISEKVASLSSHYSGLDLQGPILSLYLQGSGAYPQNDLTQSNMVKPK